MRTVIVAAAAVAFAAAAGAGEISPPGGGRALTAQQLQAMMPKLDAARANSLLKPLAAAMKEFDITTPQRQAAFLAQVAQESGELRYFEEQFSNLAAYDNRADLGNTHAGDGKKYKGRGPLMLTGRAHYKAAGQALKLDLEAKPDLVLEPEVGLRVAAWYWKAQGLNELADRGDLRQITKRVHGDYTHLDARQRYYRQAKQALGIRD
ncbi:MAG TPA: glycoside hydrolase family 19 protein [Gemmataceae bacterium]|jgi:putative chitinase